MALICLGDIHIHSVYMSWLHLLLGLPLPLLSIMPSYIFLSRLSRLFVWSKRPMIESSSPFSSGVASKGNYINIDVISYYLHFFLFFFCKCNNFFNITYLFTCQIQSRGHKEIKIQCIGQ